MSDGNISTDHFCCRHFSVHESLWNDIWCQNFVSMTEFLENDSVGETLAADSDSFQNSVASQLFQHQQSLQFSCLKAKDIHVYPHF